MKKFILSSAAVAMAMAMTTTAMAADGDSKYFKDVTANNYGWAVEYIDYIASNGIASGVGSDMYAPGSNIKRGDFAILVDKTFNFKTGNLENFALRDVAETSYYAQSIANCALEGVITERGAFYPDDNIKRIDAVTMIYRALNSQSLLSGLSTDVSMFNDKDSISGIENQTATATLYKIGLINGDDKGNLNPSSTMTRAEMAVVFAKLDKYIDEYTVEATKKAEEKAENDKIKEAEEEATKKEEAKVEESRNYSGETIEDAINASNGGAITIDDSSVNVTSDNAVSVDNASEVDITDTSIKVVGGNGINADNKSEVKIKDGSVTATNGNGIYAVGESVVTADGTDINALGNNPKYAVNVSDGAKVSITDADMEAPENYGVIKVSDGGNITLKDVTIEAANGSGKGTYAGAFDVVSTNDENSVIELENVTVNNKKGTAFYIRESDVTINIKGETKINTATLINSPEIFKQEQERGNSITLNLDDGVVIDDTRIVLDEKTLLNINIADGCKLGGQIDTDLNGYINLDMAQDAVLELDSDLYLDGFKNEANLDFDNILDNGFNIYYNESNPDNDWLMIKEYDLLLGGRLIPYTKAPMND